MVKEYKLTTIRTLMTEYIVEANSEEEAVDMFDHDKAEEIGEKCYSSSIEGIEVVNDGGTYQ